MARILVTDDAAFMRHMLKDILGKQGHEIFEACNGKDLLQKIGEVKPDLITLDITMPEMDGLEALKVMKEKDIKIPVIMCSAMGQQAMVIDAIQLGARDFIVKPFAQDRVLQAISKVV